MLSFRATEGSRGISIIFLLGIILSIILFLLHFYFVSFGVYGDGVGYYSYTHALYFHHNLDFHPEFAFYSHFTNKGITFSRIFWDISPTITGLLPNHWSIGPGILWLPFMAIGDMVAILLNIVRIHIPLDGFSPPYEISIGIGNILYGYLGLFFLYKFLNNYFPRKISFLSTFSIYLATNLFYYISIEPNLSHGVSFFIASLFLYTWKKVTDNKTLPGYMLLGFIGGLLATIRPYDAVWIVIPLSQLVFNLVRHPEASAEGSSDRSERNNALLDSSLRYASFRMTIEKILIITVSWIIGYSPQLLSQQIIYGSFWYQPYIFEGGGGTLALSHNYLFATLFSLKRGLFFWSPILLVSLTGWLVSLKTPRGWQAELAEAMTPPRWRDLFLIFLFIFLTQWQVIGHWAAALSAGFGARMYISSFPLFAIGLALFYQKVKNIKFITIIMIIFILWNLLLLNQFFVDKRLLEGQLNISQIVIGQLTSIPKMSQKLTRHCCAYTGD